MSLENGHTWQIDEIGTVRIKLSNKMVRELKKNLILIGALEVQERRETLGESILKMSSGSLVVLKGIRRNYLYYLKGCAVTKNLTALEHLKSDSTRL